MNQPNSLRAFALSLHKAHQQSLSPEKARAYHQAQQNSIKSAIQDGLDLLHQFESGQLKQDSPYYAFLSEHHLLSQAIQHNADSFFRQPNQFATQQTALYLLLDEPAIDEAHGLFFELLIGYARFDLLIQTAPLLLEFLNEKYNTRYTLPMVSCSEFFFTRLASVSIAASHLHEAINELYLEKLNADDYWHDIHAFFNATPHIDSLAHQLISMQYRPKDLSRVSLAQMLHFNGNGGDFELLKEFDELKPLAAHALNVHGTSNSSQSKFDNMALFKPIYLAFTQHVTAALKALIQDNYPSGCKLTVYDLGCGSTCQGVTPTMMACPDYHFELVASDVDFHNIELMRNQPTLPTNCKLIDVRMDDLNQPLTAKPEDIDRFDISSASIVLHQLFPEEKDRLIRYLVQVTKPGGIISTPDAGIQNTHGQLYVIPINTADREGGVDWTDFKATIVNTAHDHYVKAALPLKQYDYNAKDHPYVCHLYRVLLIHQAAIEPLSAAIKQGDWAQIQTLVETHQLKR
jgi:SAM-dependent methyltransferase